MATNFNDPLTSKELYGFIVENCNCNVEVFVRQMLICLGFRAKLEGTEYLLHTIVCRYRMSEAVGVRYSKTVYQTVAQDYCTTVACVEHAIRTAVADCYTYGNLAVLNDIVHEYVVPETNPPSNVKLINAVVKFLFDERKLGHIR